VTIPLYMDENVHGAITNGLRQRGIEVLTVQEDITRTPTHQDENHFLELLSRGGECQSERAEMLFTRYRLFAGMQKNRAQ